MVVPRRATIVVGVEVEVDVEVVVTDEVVVGAGTEVVEEIFLMPVLVGARKLKTKAPTMPTPATTASTLARGDQRVSDEESSRGWGGPPSLGGGP